MPDRNQVTRLPSVGWLIAGDAITFLLFAALGRHQHQETNGPTEALIIAAPFIVGWLAVAPWFGAFRPPARREFLQRTGLAWLCAWPVCLLLRALLQRRAIPIGFDIVALIFNAFFLLVWRGAVAAVL